MRIFFISLLTVSLAFFACCSPQDSGEQSSMKGEEQAANDQQPKAPEEMEQAAGPMVGKEAPVFTATDSNGKEHNLKDYRGKYVVLEWFNNECPFVKKHYDSKNMQQLQKKYTDKEVVWLTIVSSAPGKQGYLTPEQANKLAQTRGMQHTAFLLDPKGKVGKMYEAKTTPHMFVINPEGALIYMGAIDSTRSADADDIPQSTNYVDATLMKSMAGEEVETTSTQPYGCNVKY